MTHEEIDPFTWARSDIDKEEPLKLEALIKMPREAVFATGVVMDSPEGINMTNSGKLLRWVAQRGYAVDWGIYCHWASSTIDFVLRHGEKVHSKSHIRKLVPCTDELLARYRH